MTPRLIAFAGPIGSGKSYAAAHLCARHGFTKLSFADPLREMLLMLDPWIGADSFVDYRPERLSSILKEYGGWDGLKSSVWKTEVREWLQKLGTDLIRKVQPNWWIMEMSARLRKINHDDSKKTIWREDRPVTVVIDDCRFKNERTMVKQFGGTVVFIDNPSVSAGAHESEQFDSAWADKVITNCGTAAFLERVEGLLT